MESVVIRGGGRGGWLAAIVSVRQIRVDCVLLVIARAQAMVGMDAHECWRLPRRGQVPRAYPTIVCVTTASAGTAIVQSLLGSIRALDVNGLKLWPVQDLDGG